jgi:hypothetical protein
VQFSVVDTENFIVDQHRKVGQTHIMHDNGSTSSDYIHNDSPERKQSVESLRKERHERYLLVGIAALAIVAIAALGWRLIQSSEETAAGFIDPLTQVCTASDDTLVALGGRPAPNDSFWDGTQVIGENSILPGTYRSSGDGMCYWARLSGTTGAAEEIISSNQSNGGLQTVTILQSDAAFTSMGCGEWRAVID